MTYYYFYTQIVCVLNNIKETFSFRNLVKQG